MYVLNYYIHQQNIIATLSGGVMQALKIVRNLYVLFKIEYMYLKLLACIVHGYVRVDLHVCVYRYVQKSASEFLRAHRSPPRGRIRRIGWRKASLFHRRQALGVIEELRI